MHADVIRGGLPNNGTNNANAIADRYSHLPSSEGFYLVWLGCMQPPSMFVFLNIFKNVCLIPPGNFLGRAYFLVSEVVL